MISTSAKRIFIPLLLILGLMLCLSGVLPAKSNESAQALDISDREQYGLYTYEEFNAIIPLPELVFNAFNGQYLKVSIGKGLITLEEIAALLVRYSQFF